MTGESASSTEAAGPREVEFSISIRTILLVGVTVAVGWALASVGDILLLILVSVFGVAVLSPLVDGMERRLPWSRALCSAVLVLGIAVLLAAVLVILLQSVVDAVRGFSNDLPELIEKARQSDLGGSIDDGGGSLEFLKQNAGDITSGVGKASGGAARVGVSAFGVVVVAFSVTFLILFGLLDEPRIRASIGRLLYRDKRARYEKVADRIVQTTSRYMLGNVAISVICATVYGITAMILGLPYPLALALIAGILDLIPQVGALLAGIIIGIVALSVSLGALIAFVIVIVIYQQIENYVLQPTIIGKAARVSGFTVLVSVLLFGSLFGVVGAIIGVPIAAAVEIIVDEATAARRAQIAAADTDQVQPA